MQNLSTKKRHQEGSVVTCLHASSFWEYMDEGVGILWKHRSSCNSKFRINSWILQSHAIMLIFQNKLFGYQSPPHWICHCPCIAAFQTTERMQNPTLWQHGKWRGKWRLSYTILTSHAWALISMTCVVRFVSTCFQSFTSIDKVLTGDQRSHILAMSSFTLQTLFGLCLHRRCLRTRPMSGSCGGRTLGSEKVFDSKLVNKWKIIRNNSNNETYPMPKHMTRIHWVHPARASCLLPSPGLKCHPCHIIASNIIRAVMRCEKFENCMRRRTEPNTKAVATPLTLSPWRHHSMLCLFDLML